MNNTEIECRFLEINKTEIIKKLLDLGAVDLGEKMLEEVIIYDKDLKWREEQRFIRLRKSGDNVSISYKEHNTHTVDGTFEIELKIDDIAQAELLFEKIGLNPYRRQQKKRHTLKLNNNTFDIDTWPSIPTYLEIEGDSENALKEISNTLGLDWGKAVFHNAAWVIENVYKIKVRELRCFTFDKIE